MSDIKDEIDWEFPGAQITEAQSNYFWQGLVVQPPHGGTHGGLSDTYSNYHDYTIDWQPDTLTFAVDGRVVRTVKRSDTVVNGVAQYPSTPSRVQLSMWPAGISSSAPGTVEWAGGMINWNDPDYVSAGNFYALVSSVTVKCGDAPGPNITSYVYGSNTTASTPSISFSNRSTLVNAAGPITAVNFEIRAMFTLIFGLILISYTI
jgi:beta-glucanase (GH16 family)